MAKRRSRSQKLSGRALSPQVALLCTIRRYRPNATSRDRTPGVVTPASSIERITRKLHGMTGRDMRRAEHVAQRLGWIVMSRRDLSVTPRGVAIAKRVCRRA